MVRGGDYDPNLLVNISSHGMSEERVPVLFRAGRSLTKNGYISETTSIEVKQTENTSLRKTRTVRDLRKHFLHKGKSMEESSREISPRIARERGQVQDHVLKSRGV